MNKELLHKFLDELGAGISFACAVHCVLMPLLIGLLPLVGLSFLAHHEFEHWVVIGSIALASLSICWGVRLHRNFSVLKIFGAAVALIAIGFLLLPEAHLPFVVLGACGIAYAHIVNRKLCLNCTTCHEC